MNRLRISKSLPRFTLDVSFEFARELIVLFGPSGSGKSLTLSAIAGLLRPDRGEIVIGERTLFDSRAGIDLPPQQRRVGLVMQDYALFPHLSVADNITFGLYALPPAERSRRLEEACAQLRLDGLESRLPAALSGGQQQRVALARALVTRPELLLLDEPFAALDTPLRARLRRELLQLVGSLGLPTILVTHDLEEAHMLADRMAVFDDGRLVQIDRPETVLRRPATLAVARFTGARNILVGTVVTERGQLALESRRGRLPLLLGSAAPGDQVTCCVRPETIRLVPPDAPPPDPGAVRLDGAIVGHLDHGLVHTLMIHLDGSDSDPGHVDLEIDVDDRSYRRLGVDDREHWTLEILAADVHVIGAAYPPFFEGPAPQPDLDDLD